MISSNDLRAGSTFELDGNLYEVVSAEHIKLARGSATVKVKLRSLKTGAIFEQSFRPNDKFKAVRITKSPAQFLYKDLDMYTVMDNETYEQFTLSEDVIGENKNFMVEGCELFILRYEDKIIGVELPPSVEVKVVETEPGVKGDTVSGATKPAKISTGAVVNVPLFIEEGDTIRVDTRTGEYIERV
jgi:elongation factor P